MSVPGPSPIKSARCEWNRPGLGAIRPNQSFPAVSVSQADLDARPSLVSSRDQTPAGI